MANEPNMKRVLLADVDARSWVEPLEDEGHMVITALSGMEALQRLNAMAFDAIFLSSTLTCDDVNIAEIYLFGKAVTPPIFIVAPPFDPTVDRLRHFGLAGVLRKPVCARQVSNALSSLPAPTDTASNKSRQPLTSVPVEHIDRQALASLKEISDSHDVLRELLATGISDIENLTEKLALSLCAGRFHDARQHAYALKGVCLNLGALRLAAIANKLTAISQQSLLKHQSLWCFEIEQAVAPAIHQLRNWLAKEVALAR